MVASGSDGIRQYSPGEGGGGAVYEPESSPGGESQEWLWKNAMLQTAKRQAAALEIIAKWCEENWAFDTSVRKQAR